MAMENQKSSLVLLRQGKRGSVEKEGGWYARCESTLRDRRTLIFNCVWGVGEGGGGLILDTMMGSMGPFFMASG
jgi:hypothetical protein